MPTLKPRLALVIDERTKAKIKYLAQKHQRSVSGEIVRACIEWANQHSDEMQDMVEPVPTSEQQAQIDELLQAAAQNAYAQIIYPNNDRNTNSL